MKNADAIKYGETFAILNEKNEVVLCGKRRAINWWLLRGGQRRSKIQIDCIGDTVVETSFDILSQVLDGPHLFWRVRFYSPPETKEDSAGGFLSALGAGAAHRCTTLQE